MGRNLQTAKQAWLLVAIIAFVSVDARGTHTHEGEYPYAVSIRVAGEHFCGGVIVSNSHILTAGSCVAHVRNNPEVLQVKTGHNRLEGGETHNVSKITIHAGRANPDSLYHDVAVLKLSDPMEFKNYQSKINLPSSSLPVGVTATAIGFGFVAAPFAPFTVTLRTESVRIVENAVCQHPARGTPPDAVCAVKTLGVKGTCSEDNGGPVVYNNEVVGIMLSYVPCFGVYPDVYTNVYSHLTFINDAFQQ